MTKGLLMFDFDGVIVDSFDAALRINQAHKSDLTAEEYRKRFHGSIAKHIKDTKVPDHRVTAFFEAYLNELPGMKIVPGIAEVIAQLAEKYTLVVISSTSTAAIKRFLEIFHLQTFFSSIAGYDIESDKVTKIKTALEEFQTAPEQALYITDTLGDVADAHAAGVKSIGVTWGYHNEETLERGETEAIITTPEELVSTITTYFTTR